MLVTAIKITLAAAFIGFLAYKIVKFFDKKVESSNSPSTGGGGSGSEEPDTKNPDTGLSDPEGQEK